MVADVSTSYTAAAAMLVVALALVFVVARVAGSTDARGRPPGQNFPPEHGGRTEHKTWVQFRVRYPVVALLFGVFDMEMVYMFPWALVFRRVGLVAFLDMFVFIVILAAAIVFAWKEGAFDWEQ